VVIACATLGVGFRALWRSGRVPLKWWSLLLFGFVVHVTVLGIFTQLPAPIAEKVLNTIGLPFAVTFTPATMVLGMILAYVDDRISTRKALAISEAQLQSIIDSLPDGMTLKDKQGRILVANPTYAAWVGSTTDALVGKTRADIFPDAGVPAVTAVDRDVVNSGRRSVEELVRNFPATGERHLRTFKIPMAVGEGHDNVLLTIMVDITKEKSVQQELRAALALAEDANLAKTQFLATMSHELRTPLNAIIGFSDILHQQYFGPPGAGKYREYAKDIHSSATYLLSLVEDLLDISAIEAGASHHEPEETCLKVLATECTDAARDRAYQKDLSVTLDIPDDIPPIWADVRAVKQVFFNLLVNAIKFTPPSGAITVSAVQADGMVEVSVADNGPGIPPELIDRLLEPFTKRRQNPFTTDKGWGLGLSITRSLVEIQGGHIHIDSAPGEGTKVTFTLPVAAADMARKAV